MPAMRRQELAEDERRAHRSRVSRCPHPMPLTASNDALPHRNRLATWWPGHVMELSLGSTHRTHRRSCDARFAVREGGGFFFDLLHCDMCGDANSVAHQDLGDIHLGFVKGLPGPYAVARSAIVAGSGRLPCPVLTRGEYRAAAEATLEPSCVVRSATTRRPDARAAAPCRTSGTSTRRCRMHLRLTRPRRERPVSRVRALARPPVSLRIRAPSHPARVRIG